MEKEKIILYYAFTPLEDPDAVRLWQKTLCESLGLKGRILPRDSGIYALAFTARGLVAVCGDPDFY